MYLGENKSTISGVTSSRYASAGSLTVEHQLFVQVADGVITNDNEITSSTSEQALSTARTIESLVRSSLEALLDAKGLAKQMGLICWYADHIQGHVNELDAGALPELRSLIERLETAAWRK